MLVGAVAPCADCKMTRERFARSIRNLLYATPRECSLTYDPINMAEATKLPVKIDKKAAAPAPLGQWAPVESLRREIDRLFDSFHEGARRLPFGRPAFDLELAWPRETSWAIAPAVDVAEKEKEYEITAAFQVPCSAHGFRLGAR